MGYRSFSDLRPSVLLHSFTFEMGLIDKNEIFERDLGNHETVFVPEKKIGLRVSFLFDHSKFFTCVLHKLKKAK